MRWLAHADRMTVAQDRGLPAPGPHEMTLISAAYVDQPVRAQAGRLGLQRGDALGLARSAWKPEGGAPRIHPKIAHALILTLHELIRLIDLDLGGLLFDATLRGAGAAGEHAYRDRDKR